ncbi:MAG: flavodoxin family protein [Methanomicrobiales archaeon]
MKTLIACYSFTGTTLTVAKELQKKIDADLTQIEPVNDRWYVIKAVHAYLEKKVPIKPCETDIANYDCLIVCGPIWAGRAPSGILEYLNEVENTKGKKCASLVTMGGNGNEIASNQIKAALEEKGMEFIGRIKLGGKDLKSGNWKSMLEDFSKLF